MTVACSPILKRLAPQGTSRPAAPGERQADHLPELKGSSLSRLRDQLPTFAPLLDELELTGWSSDRGEQPGSFHDWMTLDGGMVLVAAGCITSETRGAEDMALVSQLVWTALRAHAVHSRDAGELISLVSRTVRAGPTGEPLAALVVGLVQPTEGWVNLAIAGNCLAVRIRAAACEVLQPDRAALGEPDHAGDLGQRFQLYPRERLALVAHRASSTLSGAIDRQFTGISAQDHRKMTAAQTVFLVRNACGAARPQTDPSPTSVVVLRRR